jgi:hypothetical protein
MLKLGIIIKKGFKRKIKDEVLLLSKLNYISFFILTLSYNYANNLLRLYPFILVLLRLIYRTQY